jgi:hypothetical protein
VKYSGREVHEVFTLEGGDKLALVSQGGGDWYGAIHHGNEGREETYLGNVTKALADADFELRRKSELAQVERELLLVAAVVRRDQDVERAAQHLTRALQLLSGDSLETIAGRFRDVEVELVAETASKGPK